MKLVTKCKNCRAEIKLKTVESDRIELEKEKGSEFVLECKECLKQLTYHVNEVRAKEQKLIAFIAFLILIVGTSILVYFLQDFLFRPRSPYNFLAIGGVILIPTMIYGILLRQERNNVSRFNSYRY